LHVVSILVYEYYGSGQSMWSLAIRKVPQPTSSMQTCRLQKRMISYIGRCVSTLATVDTDLYMIGMRCE
jgi:hypothetical protein